MGISWKAPATSTIGLSVMNAWSSIAVLPIASAASTANTLIAGSLTLNGITMDNND
jgi:hypothetical protein